MQHAYALLVAMDESRGVQEYAECAGVTQAVMTRILFVLGLSSQRRERGYGLAACLATLARFAFYQPPSAAFGSQMM